METFKTILEFATMIAFLLLVAYLIYDNYYRRKRSRKITIDSLHVRLT